MALEQEPSMIEHCMDKFLDSDLKTGTIYKFCARRYMPEIVRHGKNPNCGIDPEKKEYVLDLNENVIYRIEKLIEEADERYNKGLYVMVRLDPGGIQKIWNVLKKVGFRNLLSQKNAHITLIYSKKPPYKEFQRTPINGVVSPDHFKIFGGKGGKPFILALVVKSKELQRKHNQYMKEYKLSYDYFNNYTPHITVVYDIQRLLPGIKLRDRRARESVENMFNLLIKDMPKQIHIHKEEANELSTNWQY